MSLAKVKPVKVWGFMADKKLLPCAHPLGGRDFNAPCILTTLSRYRHIWRVYRAAMAYVAANKPNNRPYREDCIRRISAYDTLTDACEAAPGLRS